MFNLREREMGSDWKKEGKEGELGGEKYGLFLKEYYSGCVVVWALLV
jgi:hypothetical protein